MKQGNLPEDFPAVAALEAAGITTFAQTRSAMASDTQIPGVGPATKEKIEAALAAAEPDAEDAERDGALEIPTKEEEPPSAAELEAREEAKTPGATEAKLASQAEMLANSRFCYYEDAMGDFVANADAVEAPKEKRVKVMPISMKAPHKGLEVRDGEDVYVVTEDMMAAAAGEWAGIRSPTTGLSLIR